MSRKQPRVSVSVSKDVGERLKAYANEHRIPKSQIVEQAIAAVFDGRIKLKPPMVYDAIEDRAPWRAKQRAAAARPVVVVATPAGQRRYPRASCAVCVASIEAGTDAPIMAPWGRDGALVRICASCYTGMPRASGAYQPIDAVLTAWSVKILRVAARFDWAGPDELALALDIPSEDIDRGPRDRFDTSLSRLTDRGYLERTGKRMAHLYRITDHGRVELERQIRRAA